MSGEAILSVAKTEVYGVVEDNLKTFLKDTVLEIKRREVWIKVRNDQMKQLEELQRRAVKAFDEGKFEGIQDELIADLGKIKSESVSGKAREKGY